MWSTLQIGILKIPPEDDFIVSPFMGELPDFAIIIASTSKHSALLTIAPKFLVSVIPSNINNRIDFLLFISFSKSLIFKVEIGEIVATTP